MQCEACRAMVQDGADHCGDCGAHLEWEYKESRVRFEGLNSHTPAREQRADQTVARHLDAVRHEGWEPVGPTDLRSLRTAGRVDCERKSFGAGPPIEEFKAAKVPLRRVHAEPGPDGNLPAPDCGLEPPSERPR